VKPQESGFACDLDVQKLQTLHKLLIDDVMRARMQRAAVAWAQRFDWDVTAQSTEQVYQRLIAQRAFRDK
jgi:hypothetical protein